MEKIGEIKKEQKIRVFVNNIPYEIKFVPDTWRDGNKGEVTYSNHEILVNKDLPLEEKIPAVFHEWFHVWNNDLRADLNEETVHLIESAFRDFMKNFLAENVCRCLLIKNIDDE